METIASVVSFVVARFAAGLTRSIPTERVFAFALLSSLVFALFYVEINALDNMLAPDTSYHIDPGDNLVAFTFGAFFRTLGFGAVATIPTFVGVFVGKWVSPVQARQ